MARFTFKNLDPGVYKALAAVETAVREAHAFSDIEKELMKIRASQVNGCAYCINMHVELALKAGEAPFRISLLGAWRETDVFTPSERILLALTEEVTMIGSAGLSDATYGAALAAFGEARTAWAIMTVIAINNWNRMVMSGHMPIQ